MKLPGRTLSGVVKRFLPRSLLGRSLLIILLPLVLLQAVALQIFYGSHLDVISRRLSDGVVSELAFTLDMMHRFPEPADRDWILGTSRDLFGLELKMEPGVYLTSLKNRNILGPMDDDLQAALRSRIRLPFVMDWASDPHSVLVRVQMPDGVLSVEAPRKRLYSTSIYFYIFWVVGTASLVFVIAALFMRNQVRAIRRLAVAAEAFGMGRDTGPIKPEGATEVGRRPRPSTECRSASAVSCRSAPRYWPACRTTCARR
jgi:two-component system, OmpR family, osmolarity sensor histidine kinase EnvZ